MLRYWVRWNVLDTAPNVLRALLSNINQSQHRVRCTKLSTSLTAYKYSIHGVLLTLEISLGPNPTSNWYRAWKDSLSGVLTFLFSHLGFQDNS